MRFLFTCVSNSNIHLQVLLDAQEMGSDRLRWHKAKFVAMVTAPRIHVHVYMFQVIYKLFNDHNLMIILKETIEGICLRPSHFVPVS